VWGHLTLQDIDVNQELMPILGRFVSHNLRIINCPGFDDGVLDTMSAKALGTHIFARSARRLDIIDCPNFSVDALKFLVTSRADSQSPWVPEMKRIAIAGRVPHISPEDQLWFSQHLEEFSYHS
jgi:hypothetical protein